MTGGFAGCVGAAGCDGCAGNEGAPGTIRSAPPVWSWKASVAFLLNGESASLAVAPLGEELETASSVADGALPDVVPVGKGTADRTQSQAGSPILHSDGSDFFFSFKRSPQPVSMLNAIVTDASFDEFIFSTSSLRVLR
jgi:hypothetical protein